MRVTDHEEHEESHKAGHRAQTLRFAEISSSQRPKKWDDGSRNFSSRTSLKIQIEPENGELEDYVPFPGVHSHVPC